MPTRGLPQDVVDHILDLVGGSHPTRSFPCYSGLSEQSLDLCACTLVSRAWLPHSSRLLLNHIFLENEDCMAFIAAVQVSPRLSQAITNVTICSGRISIHDLFDEILDALPNLRMLDSTERERKFVFADLSITPWVQRISSNARARLEGLDFLGFYPAFRWTLKTQRCVEDERLARLSVEGAATSEKPSLRTVVIRLVYVADPNPNALLYHIGHEVRHLELQDYLPDRGPALALHYCQRLESITLGPPGFTSYYDDVMQSLPAALRRMTVVVDPSMSSHIIPPPRAKYVTETVDWRMFAVYVQRCKSLEAIELVGLCSDVGRRAAERGELFEERRVALLANFPAAVAAIVECQP